MPSLSLEQSGLALVAAGVIVAVTVVLTELVHDDTFFLMGLALLLVLAALPGVRAYLRGRDGSLAEAGFWLAAVGAALLVLLFAVIGLAMLLTDFDPDEARWPFPVLVAGFIAFLVAFVLLGIAVARARDLPMLLGVLLAVSLPLGLAIDIVGNALVEREIAVGYWVGVPLFAIALIWLGYVVRGGAARASGRGPAV